MRASVLTAGALAVGVAAWIASGQLDGIGAETVRPETPSPPTPLVSVRVREAASALRERGISVNGRTEASRQVVLRAETGGPVARILSPEGARVAPGDVIARQDVEDRAARLAEADALVSQRRIEHEAARRLGEKGFRSDTRVAEARARLEAAEAKAAAVRVDLGRTVIRAPFEGVIEELPIEIGAYVRPGDPVASLVDLDPVVAVGFVSERRIGHVVPGMSGSIRLVDDGVAGGRVRFVASVADPATRSFRVEMEVPNPDGRIKAGATAEIRLSLPPAKGHLLPPSVLTLADDGRIGVRVVGRGDVVAFVPVSVVGDSPEGMWVSGLRDGMRIITVGQEFVKSGQRVRPVEETAETAS